MILIFIINKVVIVMGFWPTISNVPGRLITIDVNHLLSLGGSFCGLVPVSVNFVFGANGAIFVPFRIPRPLTVQSFSLQNGTAVAGNIDMGIYTPGGTRLVSTGSTAQAGISVTQTVAATATRFGPGLFYMALAMSNAATARILAQNFTPNDMAQMLGLATMAAAFPLPATAVFASVGVANLFVPQFGLTARSFV